MSPARPTLMVDLLQDHLDELDFLWEQRERIIYGFDYDLDGLDELETRAWAHIEGLKLGGADAVDLVLPAFGADAAGAATAATFVLLAVGSMETEAQAALVDGTSEIRDGVRIALRHCAPPACVERLRALAISAEPEVRAAAIDVLAFRRLEFPTTSLAEFAEAGPLVQRLTIGTIGRGSPAVGSCWEPDSLAAALESQASDVRRSALEASARVGMSDLAERCRRVGARREAPIPEALAFVGVVGEAVDVDLLVDAVARKQLAAAALEGLGRLGYTSAIPHLIQAMSDATRAHAAGAAFRRITGADDIDADQPLPPPPDVSEEDADFLDTSLPPDPSRAEDWWNQERHRFHEGQRWQAGLAVSEEPLGAVFDRLPLPCRRDVYLRERAREPEATPDLELESRAALQKRAGRG